MSAKTNKESPELDFVVQVNKEATRLSDALDSYIKARRPIIASADTEEVSRRVRQVFFLSYFDTLYHRVFDWREDRQTLFIGLPGLGPTGLLEFREGREFKVLISWRLIVSRISKLIATWGLSTTLVFLGLFSRQSKTVNALSIVYNPNLKDYIGPKEQVQRFYDFCFKGKFEFLKSSDLIISQHASNQVSTDGKLRLTRRNPYFEALSHLSYRLPNFLDYLFFSARLFLQYAWLCARSPVFVLLSRDVALWPLIRLLNSTGSLKNIVLNTAQIYEQEMWMHSLPDRRFEVRCIWFGMSLKTLAYKGVDVVEWPALKFYRVEHNYLWNRQHEKDVLEVLPGAIKNYVMGSNLWFNPHPAHESRTGKRIAVFINNPRNSKMIEGRYSKRLHYYNSFEITEKFYSDIRWAADKLQSKLGITVDIAVKMKRSDDPSVYDHRNHGLLSRMEIDGCRIFDLEKGDDLYQFIANADVTICTPMASPNFISHEFNVPAIYYDPISVVQPFELIELKINWAANKDDLYEKLRSVLT